MPSSLQLWLWRTKKKKQKQKKLCSHLKRACCPSPQMAWAPKGPGTGPSQAPAAGNGPKEGGPQPRLRHPPRPGVPPRTRERGQHPEGSPAGQSLQHVTKHTPWWRQRHRAARRSRDWRLGRQHAPLHQGQSASQTQAHVCRPRPAGLPFCPP